MKNQFSQLLLLGAALLSFQTWGCRKVALKDHGGFPKEIGEIMIANCALAGCHDDNSYVQEGRLALTGWEAMFKGSRAGAAVVPHRIDQSYLLNFINVDSSLGLTQTPVMPLGTDPLSSQDYLLIQNWIANGAPNDMGQIKFADDPNRAKVYVINQGCDQVSILDRESMVVMRYVDIGIDPALIESPHYIRLSPDKRYWYVIFLIGNPHIEKYDAVTDQLVGRVLIGDGYWNTFSLTPDGRYAFAVDLNGGIVSIADVENMQGLGHINTGVGTNPHGSAFNPAFTALYVTDQERSRLYKIEFDADPTQPEELNYIDLIQTNPNIGPQGKLGPHELGFTPDGTKYAVTCQYADQVRFYNTANDSLLATILVGAGPVEMDFDQQSGLLFVTCSEDTVLNSGNPLKRGSVAVIDYQNMSLETEVYTGYQPHGVEVDEAKRWVYIANRNVNPNGPAPHHSTSCGGRNGYLTIIDIPTRSLVEGFRHELSVDPYSILLRD